MVNGGPLLRVLLAMLGLGVLTIVHEAGHFFIARAFGMRATKFSLGFGPVIWSKKPEGSDTTYQVALFPFISFVQIAGMNPYEEIDPDDKGSYANNSWLGRTLTIFAGPAANYLFAVVAFFFLLTLGGRPDIDGLTVGIVDPAGSAAKAQLVIGDTVKSVDGHAVAKWGDMREQIQSHKGQEIPIVVDRAGKQVELKVTPSEKEGRIGIGPKEIRTPVSVGVAAKEALIQPPKIAGAMVVGLWRLITGKEKAELRGPVGIVEEASTQMKAGWESGVEFFTLMSIYLCVFNLLPFPALDGGRLAFLGYEFVARRRADAKAEAFVHALGMMALLLLFVPLFFFESWKAVAKLLGKG